ncbi:type B 50S ribosomal protein L31 [uncultured Nocardioides sp.]|uniref:type B 50S ribosomal protein L31 n=1 Tax=uncultured Nocardioides sp. TaxID=198441 RepID=UPI00261A5507|nr:type B 50S ribosomal protein L31 [uncultured Nocardioides sp.]
MKKDIHPAYGPVVFRDRSADLLVLTRSTLVGRQDGPTVELDGATYPVVDVDVSSASHPFWTGRGRVVDTEGRVQAFQRRYGARQTGGGGR